MPNVCPWRQHLAMRSRWVRAVSLCIALACVPVSGVADVSREDKIKVAFLYNFAKFIDWPKQTTHDALHFCVLGTGAVVDALGQISGKTIRGQAISVTKLGKNDTGAGCHLLFVAGEKGSTKSRIRSLQVPGTVTVGENEQFVRGGGVIGFTRRESTNGEANGSRIGFAINVAAATQAGVQISSELLKLATLVEGKR